MISPQDRSNEKIQATEGIIKNTTELLNQLNLPDFAKKIQLDSMNKRLKKLKEEHNVIQRTNEIEELIVTMHPKELPSGQISVRSLTAILGGFQHLSDSIANTLYNQPSEKGKIPQEILDFNEMIFKEARPGSFQAVLELKHSPQSSIEEPVQSQTLTELFELLFASEGEETLSDSISFLGPRTLRNYAEWTKVLKDLDTGVEVEWISSLKGTSKVRINPEKAEGIYKMLSDFSEPTEEEILVDGRLTGANVRIKTFEIYTKDDEIISGRISKNALQTVASFPLDQQCIATLLKVITKSKSKEKVTWTLKSIKNQD